MEVLLKLLVGTGVFIAIAPFAIYMMLFGDVDHTDPDLFRDEPWYVKLYMVWYPATVLVLIILTAIGGGIYAIGDSIIG